MKLDSYYKRVVDFKFKFKILYFEREIYIYVLMCEQKNKW